MPADSRCGAGGARGFAPPGGPSKNPNLYPRAGAMRFRAPTAPSRWSRSIAGPRFSTLRRAAAIPAASRGSNTAPAREARDDGDRARAISSPGFAVGDGRAAPFELADLKVHFPLRGRRRACAAGKKKKKKKKEKKRTAPLVRVVPSTASRSCRCRRDAGTGGRIGLRQVHGGARAGAAGGIRLGADHVPMVPISRSHDEAYNKVRSNLQRCPARPPRSPRLPVRRIVESRSCCTPALTPHSSARAPRRCWRGSASAASSPIVSARAVGRPVPACEHCARFGHQPAC